MAQALRIDLDPKVAGYQAPDLQSREFGLRQQLLFQALRHRLQRRRIGIAVQIHIQRRKVEGRCLDDGPARSVGKIGYAGDAETDPVEYVL